MTGQRPDESHCRCVSAQRATDHVVDVGGLPASEDSQLCAGIPLLIKDPKRPSVLEVLEQIDIDLLVEQAHPVKLRKSCLSGRHNPADF